MISCAAGACAQGLDGGADSGAGDSDGAAIDTGAKLDAAKVDADSQDAGISDSEAPDADAGPQVGYLGYQCPVYFSVGCVSASACESTCLGQFQSAPTCTWYSSGGTGNPLACTPVSALTAVATCPSELSTSCSDMTVCESTCVGQFQPGATCTVRGTSGTPTDVPCMSAFGQGSLTLYQCPTVASNGCVDTSACQSTCVGQISNLSTCTSRGPSGVGTTQSCTLLGNQTF